MFLVYLNRHYIPREWLDTDSGLSVDENINEIKNEAGPVIDTKNVMLQCA